MSSTPQAGVTANGSSATPTQTGTVSGAASLPVTGSAPVTAGQPEALPMTGKDDLPEELALGGFLIALGAAVRRIGRPRAAVR
jgi:hypothetical protein